jgi:hypothetical protein
MAGTRTTDFPAASAINSGDSVVGNVGGVTKKIPIELLGNESDMGLAFAPKPGKTSDLIKWNGKTVLWLGTSIPAGDTTGSYPKEACNKIGANCYNQALGSSMIRKARKDGSYVGLSYQLLTNSLSQTIAEKNSIISNWSTIQPTLVAGAPADITPYIPLMLSASYENRLVPYLNGTFPAPDLIVIDHGYNDYQCAVLSGTQDNTTDFTTVPTPRNDRNYFLGAINYIVDVIFSFKPKMRIAFGGHYENQLYPNIATAQQTAASYWEFPLYKLWEKTGWSQQLISGVTAKDTWLTTDHLHPNEPDSRKLLTDLYAYFLTTIF